MKFVLMFVFILMSCSRTEVIDNRTHGQPDPWIIRGEMEMKVDSFNGAFRLASAPQEFPQPVTGFVVEAVKFTVSNANFILPTYLVNQVNYGSLDVTSLYDNRLRVCGVNGREKCKTAALKIFTRGKGAGFWNEVDGYGAPILTNGNNVGLDVGGAYVVKTVNITPLKFVVKFSDFSPDNKPFQIPVSIDFTDAPYGDYATTLVIQYALQ